MQKHFRKRRLSLGKSLSVSVLACMLVLLSPDQPLEKIIGCGTEQIDAAGIEKIHETLKLYSILMSQMAGLGNKSVWSTAETILEESRRHSLDPTLILAVIDVESRFQRAAVSPVGARGLMQIHPAFAPALAVEAEIPGWQGLQSLDDPILNIKMGTFYLSQMKKRFRDLKLALSAYNIGPTELQKRLRERESIPTGYVNRVLAAHRLYQEPERQAPRVASLRPQGPRMEMQS